jgi:FK506-binding protein 2
MLFFKWFSVLALAVVAYAEGAASDEPKELIIKTTYSPPECVLKAEKGDKLHVHYVCGSAVSISSHVIWYP